ncbi:MAG: chromate efflux transporter [Myxococcaceae bacterium]|nr:chromate efflux transporter [Myxococcaceae bacterium]
MPSHLDTPVRLTLAQAFPVWLRIGLLSFGGPAGQIAVMHRELVERRRWISDERFLHALNFCMLLPGPEAQQLATYIGWLLHRSAGGLVAGGLFVLPGALVMMALSIIYVTYRKLALVEALFFGVKAAVLAIVVEAVIRVGKRALKTPAAVGIAATAFISLFALNVPFPAVVLGSALAGVWLLRQSAKPGASTGHQGGASLVEQLLAQGQLGHIVPNNGRALITGLLGCALWAVPVLAVWAWRGTGDVLTQEGVLFSEAAMVTFGGAYAVLSWISHQVVVTHAWLSSAQMIDGLGLAETTPGPLILVLQFTGFVAAYQHAAGLPPLLAGVLGALITLWVTFVPCFLWIFTFAPYVERARGSRYIAPALAGITAGVVGIILNLSIYFALHVLFRGVDRQSIGPLSLWVPSLATFDWKAIAVSVVAFAMLLRFKQGLARTLIVSALLGLLLRLWS